MAAGKALRHHAVERRGHQEGFDAEFEQASGGTWGIVGVQGRQHQVAGQCGLNGDLSRFAVANFADHNDIGVCAQNRTQGVSKGQAGL